MVSLYVKGGESIRARHHHFILDLPAMGRKGIVAMGRFLFV